MKTMLAGRVVRPLVCARGSAPAGRRGPWLALLALAVFVLAAPCGAASWMIERLFTRPFAWGTRPEQAAWSERGHRLLFLWNAEGKRFLDLYAWHADRQKLVRLSNLEGADDPLHHGPAEKDERRKQYLMPRGGLSGFAISRDGTRAAFGYQGDLYLVETDGSKPPFQLTRTKAAESGPQFSPDGRRLAFTRDGQIYFEDLQNGQVWQVTDIESATGSLGAWEWSRDGKRFVYTIEAGGARKLPLPNYSGRTVTAEGFERTLPGDPVLDTKTYVVASEGGTARELAPGPWGAKVYSYETLEWSPDSTHVLQVAVHPNLKQAQVLVQDAASGKTTVVFEDKDAAWVDPMFATWSPDGRTVLVLSDRDGWHHLYTVPREGGTPRQVTRGAWEVDNDRMFGHAPQWAGEYLYYTSTEAGTAERQYFRIRPDGTGKERLSEREGMNIGIVSKDGTDVSLLSADLKNPFDLWANGQRVTRSPRPEFAQYQWPETRFVRFPSRGDGRIVAAKILLPPGYRLEDRAQKPRAAVFFIHGSGYATSVLKQWGSYQEQRYAFNCYLANQGYVVMDLDYRGSSGYGRDWRTGVYLHMGGKDLDDVLGAVDYLRGLGNIDMAKVGIWGSSYGGFMTNMAMFLSPDTFRAGAAFSAVNDWENYNAFYTGQRLTTPQENPEAYRRSSPIHFSGMLRHPLLMVHGIVDNNVMVQDAMQLSEKLIHEGKPFEEMYYPEESHLFVRDETLIDAFRRAAEFFDRNLR
ncbi:MAG TPA: S9 family peptidase [Bryobacteraceae bacterium]|nr:S9 family peptidase [Bryobacteraceae bacterium]